MMSSVDGRIDCAMTEQIDPTDAYYVALDALKCDATLEGRVTKQIHYALPQPFEAHDKTAIGKEAFHKATPGPHYDVAVALTLTARCVGLKPLQAATCL